MCTSGSISKTQARELNAKISSASCDRWCPVCRADAGVVRAGQSRAMRAMILTAAQVTMWLAMAMAVFTCHGWLGLAAHSLALFGVALPFSGLDGAYGRSEREAPLGLSDERR